METKQKDSPLHPKRWKGSHLFTLFINLTYIIFLSLML